MGGFLPFHYAQNLPSLNEIYPRFPVFPPILDRKKMEMKIDYVLLYFLHDVASLDIHHESKPFHKKKKEEGRKGKKREEKYMINQYMSIDSKFSTSSISPIFTTNVLSTGGASTHFPTYEKQ